MTELPPATSRRELRERERVAQTPTSRRVGGSRGHAPRPARPAPAHSIGRRLLSFAAMIFAGALAIGMSVPANAFFPATSSAANLATTADVSSQDVSSQAVSVPSDAAVAAGERDTFTVLSWAQVLAEKYSHNTNYDYTGGSGSIRWPFPYQVKISSPYGPRVAPCAGCSTFHKGVDFTPGAGAAIFAIADGVVTSREDGTSQYGNFVVITHHIDGHTVTSTYAHMTKGSSAIVLGQSVGVGDFLGLVGMTGEATGPHLHFEIAVDGVTIDPIPWLEANVN